MPRAISVPGGGLMDMVGEYPRHRRNQVLPSEVGCPWNESCVEDHVVNEGEWSPEKNQSSP